VNEAPVHGRQKRVVNLAKSVFRLGFGRKAVEFAGTGVLENRIPGEEVVSLTIDGHAQVSTNENDELEDGLDERPIVAVGRINRPAKKIGFSVSANARSRPGGRIRSLDAN
jgi:hypothetical protein